MPANQLSDCRGVTLLETMIALLIFSVGVLGVASMQIGSMFNNVEARRATQDTLALCQYVEAIHSLPFDDPLLTDDDHGYAPSTPDHGPFVVPATLSTIEWEVADQDPIANAKRVSLTVRRASQGVQERMIAYEYIKIKGEIDVPDRR